VAKPAIKQADPKQVAKPGEIVAKPGKDELILEVGATTVYLNSEELFSLMIMLDYHAHRIWSDRWDGMILGWKDMREERLTHGHQ
jgi:hypothetical protein